MDYPVTMAYGILLEQMKLIKSRIMRTFIKFKREIVSTTSPGRYTILGKYRLAWLDAYHGVKINKLFLELYNTSGVKDEAYDVIKNR